MEGSRLTNGPLTAVGFARLKPAERIWAIAAVHGEAARLDALAAAILARVRTGDKLVVLGNVIGRGAHSVAAIDALLRLRAAYLAVPRMFVDDFVMLRGCQEEMLQKLLELQFAVNPAEVLEWMMAQGVGATIEAYGMKPQEGFVAARQGTMALTRWTSEIRAAFRALPGHQSFMSALRRAAVSAERRLLFVSAGLDPAKPLEKQRDSLWWGTQTFARLAAPYEEFARIVRGHDPARNGFAERPHTLTLDSGAGFGGALAAACLDAGGAILERLEF